MVATDLTPFTMLIGFGYLAIMCVFAAFFWQLVRILSSCARGTEAMTDRDNKYLLFEETMVDKFASEKGIDLKKEEVYKQEQRRINRKEFRKVVQDELIKKVSSEQKK